MRAARGDFVCILSFFVAQTSNRIFGFSQTKPMKILKKT